MGKDKPASITATGIGNRPPALSSGIRTVLYTDIDIRRGEKIIGYFRPFNQANTVVIKIITNINSIQFFRSSETKQIKMIDDCVLEGIRFNQGIGGALDRSCIIVFTQKSFNPGRFARTQFTPQKNRTTGRAVFGRPCSQTDHGFGVGNMNRVKHRDLRAF